MISRAFYKRRPALMPYFPLGYPDLATSIAIVKRLCQAGADIVELGIPFSDPLADGPTIQAATQAALESGVTVAGCLDAVGELRQAGVKTPLVLMSYFNPIHKYGMEKFVSACSGAGADGLIIPDLPPEEATDLLRIAGIAELDLIFLLAPNSPPDRISLVTRVGTGFVYLVSLTGVTGARQRLPDGLPEFIQRVREATRLPLAVGFGISSNEQVREVGRYADGVIIGSALVDHVRQAIESQQDPMEAAEAYLADMIPLA